MARKAKVHKKKRQEVFDVDIEERGYKKNKVPIVEESFSDSDNSSKVRGWKGNDGAHELDNPPLPIRTVSGKWREVLIKRDHCDEHEESVDSPLEAEEGENMDSDAPAKTFGDVKKELAACAIFLMEDTESNMGKMKDIFTYADFTKHPVEVVKLSLLTILAIFKDILPGYYIRPLGDAEKAASVSKDVKKSRDFEQTMLRHYHRFYELLKDIIQPRYRHSKKRLGLLPVAIKSVRELMSFASHFNYFEQILNLATYSLTLPIDSVVNEMISSFQSLFQEDEAGQVSMIAVRLLSNMIKDRGYDCPAAWLDCLETVRIRSEIKAGSGNDRMVPAAKFSRKHLSGRQKKEWKVKQEELAKLAKSEAETSVQEMNKWNREILKHLFRIYFGILKMDPPRPTLLPPVLVGLSRHAHRIGIDYFTDLLHSLRRLMSNQELLDVIPTLHCIITADRIYSLNENLAGMDLKFFYDCLYKQLCRVLKDPSKIPSLRGAKESLEKCFACLFNPKRMVPFTRLAAFCQKLVDLVRVCSETDLSTSVFLAEMLKNLFIQHPKSRDLLDEEPFGQGIYLISCEDPDLSNPFTRPFLPILRQIISNGRCRGKLLSNLNEIAKLGSNNK